MTRDMALRVAQFQQERKVEIRARLAREAAARKRQWEQAHFQPSVYGSPPSDWSRKQYEDFIEDARKKGQNVFFGDRYAREQHYDPELRSVAREPRYAAQAQREVAAPSGGGLISQIWQLFTATD